MPRNEQALRETANLIQEVKAFGQTRGLEPTGALSRTTEQQPALSLLWLWLQRDGTIALHGPIDIRLAIGFSNGSGRIPLEQVYRVDGYSVYYRQGNEFADERSVATLGFAAEAEVRRVTVVLHEDLHGDNNFDLPWETEEAIVTPLGALAAVDFFRERNDAANLKSAVDAVDLQRKFSRELNDIILAAEEIFRTAPPPEAKAAILDLIPKFPTYNRFFQRQIAGQHPPTVLEAKLSHDLAYYRYFDRIAALSEKTPSLKVLIAELKKLPHDARQDDLDRYLNRLEAEYGVIH
ncbi:MAG TPA: hypothetical protein VIB79_10220 [Candidatus Binatia bacterium]|jgi:hypothetical protein